MGHFDKLHSTESTFGQPRVSGATLVVPALKLVLLRGHPLCELGWMACKGELLFHGAVASRRTLHEYIGDPTSPAGFREFEVVDDFGAVNDSADLETFAFEGTIEPPPAWIGEWIVRARSFELSVPDDGEAPLFSYPSRLTPLS